jgi:hypothetical protein
MGDLEMLLDRLRQSGWRVTRQRRAILAAIWDLNGHAYFAEVVASIRRDFGFNPSWIAWPSLASVANASGAGYRDCKPLGALVARWRKTARAGPSGRTERRQTERYRPGVAESVSLFIMHQS